jgi:DNA-binding beta-propeller fold protein YncE
MAMRELSRILACAVCAAATFTQGAWTSTSVPGARTLALTDQPTELALAAGARVLAVATEGEETVKLVNPDTGVVTGSIKLDKKPLAVALNANATRLFVLQQSRKSIYVYNTATGATIATWSFNGDPAALALRPNTAELIVADQSGKRIVAVNAATGAVVRQRSLSSKPDSISVNAADTRVLVGTTDGRLVTLDAATLAVISNVAVGEQARWVGFWDKGGIAVVVQKKTDALSLVNVENGAVVARVELSTDPEQGAIDAAGTKAYVSTKDDLGVNQIDLERRKSDGRFILPSRAAGLIFDPVARVVYVSLSKDNAIYCIDPAQHPMLSEVVLKKRLRDISINNATHEAATIADKADELSRVRLLDRQMDALALPERPSLLAVDSGRNLAVLATKKTIRFANLATRPPVLLPGTVALTGEPRALAVDSTRGLTIVLGKGGEGDDDDDEDEDDGDDNSGNNGEGGQSRIHVVDNTTRALIATVTSKESLRSVAIDAQRGLAYIVTGTKKLLTFNIATRAFTRTSALAFQADAIAADAELNLAVLTDAKKDKVYVVNLANASTVRTIDVPRGPVAVQIQPESHTAVIVSKEADQVSLLELPAGALAPGYAAVDAPFALALSGRYNQAWVLSGEKDDITIVALPNPRAGAERHRAHAGDRGVAGIGAHRDRQPLRRQGEGSLRRRGARDAMDRQHAPRGGRAGEPRRRDRRRQRARAQPRPRRRRLQRHHVQCGRGRSAARHHRDQPVERHCRHPGDADRHRLRRGPGKQYSDVRGPWIRDRGGNRRERHRDPARRHRPGGRADGRDRRGEFARHGFEPGVHRQRGSCHHGDQPTQRPRRLASHVDGHGLRHDPGQQRSQLRGCRLLHGCGACRERDRDAARGYRSGGRADGRDHRLEFARHGGERRVHGHGARADHHGDQPGERAGAHGRHDHRHRFRFRRREQHGHVRLAHHRDRVKCDRHDTGGASARLGGHGSSHGKDGQRHGDGTGVHAHGTGRIRCAAPRVARGIDDLPGRRGIRAGADGEHRPAAVHRRGHAFRLRAAERDYRNLHAGRLDLGVPAQHARADRDGYGDDRRLHLDRDRAIDIGRSDHAHRDGRGEGAFLRGHHRREGTLRDAGGRGHRQA